MEENVSQEIDTETKSVEDAKLPGQEPAAFTLVIQSWVTPIIGVVMLIAGLLGGYYLRPLISPASVPVSEVGGSSSVETGAEPTTVPTPNATQSAQQQELMSVVVERTRHFLGDPNAPVTIIEFSDFQ